MLPKTLPGSKVFTSLKRRIKEWIRQEIVDDDPWDDDPWDVEEALPLSESSNLPETGRLDPSVAQLNEQPIERIEPDLVNNLHRSSADVANQSLH